MVVPVQLMSGANLWSNYPVSHHPTPPHTSIPCHSFSPPHTHTLTHQLPPPPPAPHKHTHTPSTTQPHTRARARTRTRRRKNCRLTFSFLVEMAAAWEVWSAVGIIPTTGGGAWADSNMLTAPKVERWAETAQRQGIRKEATQCASTRTHVHSTHASKLKMRMQCIQDIVGNKKKLRKKKKNWMREGKKPHTNKQMKQSKKEEKERKKKMKHMS